MGKVEFSNELLEDFGETAAQQGPLTLQHSSFSFAIVFLIFFFLRTELLHHQDSYTTSLFHLNQ